MSHYTICLHPWADTEHGRTYAEDQSAAIGWCVYVREDSGDTCDIAEETDFPSYDAALAYAETLAAKYDAEIDQY
jgi:hypothetical protein